MRQCWVQFEGAIDTLARFPISLNILKYASGFPPIWLAAAASVGYFHPELPHWTAVFASINSIFSFMVSINLESVVCYVSFTIVRVYSQWDIVMDWGLFSFSRHTGLRPQCRKRYMFPYITYPILVIFNFALRFSWVANRIPALASMHSSRLIFLVEVAEVLRRSVWNYYRIEWEVLVQSEKVVSKHEDEIELLLPQSNSPMAGNGKNGSGMSLLSV
jgi:hypothetical protein